MSQQADPNSASSPATADGDRDPGATASRDAAAENSRSLSPRERFEQEKQRYASGTADDDEERTLWTGGYSPRAMVGTWILLAALSIAGVIAAVLIEPLPIGITLIVLVVLWLLGGLYYAKQRLGVQYELTSQRFIHKTGILTRRSDRIEVIDIDDVSYQQGPFQRVFGVGMINITSSDRSDPELRLIGIDQVSEVAGLIDDVRRAERRRRSLHIESI